MSIVILGIFQITLVIVLVALVLLQPPRGSSLDGFSGSQQGFNTIVPIKSSSNLLTKITVVVAGLFIINTLLLSGLYSKDLKKKSIIEKIEMEQKNKTNSVPFESE
ncbi:preprotein translocase subunit SecG [Wolbachia endosymbiont of Chironomus riparius]|uniref:preprotein translocase subunit SecG n=1 Tax=Wolbachia endosymbiont of Chironomus riparius TaxID=2883238 RepID=UPI00209CFA96|nr:preprotein translocase subunit SecG [Wolbachia endosymbiont of Chironomus riparius]